MTEAAVLKHIAKLPHARATFKQLVKELSVKGDLRHALDSILDRLTDKGERIGTRNAIFVMTRASREFILGRLVAHRDGYGFVVPDPPVECAGTCFCLLARRTGRCMGIGFWRG